MATLQQLFGKREKVPPHWMKKKNQWGGTFVG